MSSQPGGNADAVACAVNAIDWAGFPSVRSRIIAIASSRALIGCTGELGCAPRRGRPERRHARKHVGLERLAEASHAPRPAEDRVLHRAHRSGRRQMPAQPQAERELGAMLSVHDRCAVRHPGRQARSRRIASSAPMTILDELTPVCLLVGRSASRMFRWRGVSLYPVRLNERATHLTR